MDKKAAAGAVAAAVERRTPPRPQLFLQTPKKKTRKKQQQQNHPVPSAFRFQNSNVRIISAEIRRVAVSRAPFCGAHLVPFWNRFGIVAESLRNRAIFDGEGHLLPRQRPADCADGSMNELEGIGWKTTTTTTTTTTTKKEAPKTGSFRWKLFNQKKKKGPQSISIRSTAIKRTTDVNRRVNLIRISSQKENLNQRSRDGSDPHKKRKELLEKAQISGGTLLIEKKMADNKAGSAKRSFFL